MAADVAFLVLAHDRPGALRGLLDDLAATGQPVFLHADRTGHALDALMPEFARYATCLPRRSATWGGYSLLQVTLALLEAGHRATAARHFVLLSNACMPVWPFSELQRMLAGSDLQYIDQFSIARAAEDKRPERLERYVFMPKRTPRFVAQLINQTIELIPRQPFAAGFGQPRFGGSWWTLSRGFADWLLEFRIANAAFDRRFRATKFPEEAYFHTALARSPFADRVAPSLTYTDWSLGGPHPKTLTRAELPAIEASGSFFARKYLRESDPDLTAELSARWRS